MDLIKIIVALLLIYLIYTIYKIYNLKRKQKSLLKEYTKEVTEIEHQEVDTWIQDIKNTNDYKLKMQILSSIYKDKIIKHKRFLWASKSRKKLISDNKIKLRHFEVKLQNIAPQLLKIDTLDKFIYFILKCTTFVLICIPLFIGLVLLADIVFGGVDAVKASGSVGFVFGGLFIIYDIWKRIPWVYPIKYNRILRSIRAHNKDLPKSVKNQSEKKTPNLSSENYPDDHPLKK